MAGGETIGEIQLVDISPAALDMTGRRLRQLGVDVAQAHLASYEDGLALAVRHRGPDGPLAVLFLGSNIGNFDPPVRQDCRADTARLRPGDALFLGTDLEARAGSHPGLRRSPAGDGGLQPERSPPDQ